MTRFPMRVLFGFLTLWCVDRSAGAQETLADVVARVERSVVGIARLSPADGVPIPETYDPFLALGSLEQGPVPDSVGTGVIVKITDSRRLYILTNHHLLTARLGIKGAETDQLYLRVTAGHTVRAQVQAFDPRSDLAVLTADLVEITAEALQISPLVLGRGERLRKGDDIFVLGNPWGLAKDGSVSLARGSIANLHVRPAPIAEEETVNSPATIHQLGTLLQLDMRLPVGLSGGGLFTVNGDLVGLTTLLPALRGDPTSAGFAIPFDAGMRRVIETLLRGEEVEYGFLGIDPESSIPADLIPARRAVTQGSCAVVGRVSRGSPAAEGGLQEGDLILTIDGETVRQRGDLVRIVGLAGPEAQARLNVFRPRTRQQLDILVHLAKWPVFDDSRLIATQPQWEPWQGLTLDYVTGRFRYLPDAFLADFPQGVMIAAVEPNSPAAKAGLRVGMSILQFNGHTVRSPRELFDLAAVETAPFQLQLTGGTEVVLNTAP